MFLARLAPTAALSQVMIVIDVKPMVGRGRLDSKITTTTVWPEFTQTSFAATI